MAEVIKVGMADLNIVKPPNTIRTAGLGSCVGVVLYDEDTKISGMAHVMLPDSNLSKTGQMNVAKYADTAIIELVRLLEEQGASKRLLKAKMAGGSQMFQFTTASEMMRIGPRNVEAVKQQLSTMSIPIIAEDVGGNSGRTIEFNPDTNMLMVKTVNQGVKEI
ncbi:chemotaxis protein CheD [Bacillus alkalicellulosilyticus]|uniref:chemotaxis protein CheD n=1 Tax=Alkalihalobacterium alkalicellulosilyticum TaxID=1912214 RepID=UPI000998BC1A|nr:chemotaxis protein CheD [Bacillus alkalicellulosilyticus]